MILKALEAIPHIYHRWTEPTLCALRKSRLAVFNCTGLPDIAVLDLDAQCGCPACVPMVRETRAFHGKYETRTGLGRFFGPTGTIIDHDAYPTYSVYEKAVAQASNRSITRAARKAERSGLIIREINRSGWLASIAEIEQSKLFRSGGLMLPALIETRRNLADTKAVPEPPDCPRHWRRTWGVFAILPDGSERLAAVHGLWRIGAYLRTCEFLCHGDYLRIGAAKFIFLDRMHWLLDREDPHCKGIRYHRYGALEHGNSGLVEWKRLMKFKPMTLGFG
jgi:hypothetical protein